MAAKRLFPRGYGDGYSAAVLDQLKAWETFQTLNIGWRENTPMPAGDVTPPECPRAQYYDQAPETFLGRPVLTSRACETTCWSQASSSQTIAADQKLQQKLMVKLLKMGEEELKSVSSTGSARQLRSSTAVESARPRSAEVECMEVDTPAVQATSQNSRAGVATHPVTQGASASQARAQSTGPRTRPDLKTKQCTTDQQGVHDIVVGVLEHQGVSQEDWEQSQRTNYRVEPLLPPTWVVYPTPGQHLASPEGAPVDEWLAEPNITLEQLFRQLTELAKCTSQACIYQSQESYFRHSQQFKQNMHSYEAEQGLQYRERPVHLDSEIEGSIIATVTNCSGSYERPKMHDEGKDLEVDAKVHLRRAENEVAQLGRDLFKSQEEMLEAQGSATKYEKNYHETLVQLERAQAGNQSAPNQADQVRIQSLEELLNNSHQQLNQLCAGHAPSAAEGQLAVQ